MAFGFIKKAGLAQPAPKTAEIYIGIDFGTTFTKVSFQVGGHEGTRKYSLRLIPGRDDCNYFLPSVLGYDARSETLVFTQKPKKAGLETIKYFKYSMIQKGVPRSKSLAKGGTANDPQRLCSAFYLAHVLNYAKERIFHHRAVDGKFDDFSWYVNMGVPVSDFTAKPKPVYDEALNVAWRLIEDPSFSDKMNLGELDRFYSQWIDHHTWNDRLNTVPELYAEIIMFLQDKSVDTGFYSVIDIGGGTIDMAVFFKHIDVGTKAVEIYCVAQEVCPLGYELWTRRPDAREIVKKSYGTMVIDAYQKHKHQWKAVRKNGRRFVHFFMGGAGKVRFYHQVLDEMVNIHKRSLSDYPGFTKADMVNYMQHNSVFEVKNNSRLLISQMLAQPFETMPRLAGHPWHFTKVEHVAPSAADLQLEIYGG